MLKYILLKLLERDKFNWIYSIFDGDSTYSIAFWFVEVATSATVFTITNFNPCHVFVCVYAWRGCHVCPHRGFNACAWARFFTRTRISLSPDIWPSLMTSRCSATIASAVASLTATCLLLLWNDINICYCRFPHVLSRLSVTRPALSLLAWRLQGNIYHYRTYVVHVTIDTFITPLTVTISLLRCLPKTNLNLDYQL